jgi:hypothetical protein
MKEDTFNMQGLPFAASFVLFLISLWANWLVLKTASDIPR